MIEREAVDGMKEGSAEAPTRREIYATYGLSQWEDWMETAGWWFGSLMTDIFQGREQGKEPVRILLPRLRIATVRGDGTPLGYLFGIQVREGEHTSIIWEIPAPQNPSPDSAAS